VKGLTNKKKYRFRVLAENLAGPGKPSRSTEPILIKDPIGIISMIFCGYFNDYINFFWTNQIMLSLACRSSMASWKTNCKRCRQNIISIELDKARTRWRGKD
jgi:hypothetical protein